MHKQTTGTTFPDIEANDPENQLSKQDHNAHLIDGAEHRKRGRGRPPKEAVGTKGAFGNDADPSGKSRGSPKNQRYFTRRDCAQHYRVSLPTWDRWCRENPELLGGVLINGNLRRWTSEQLGAFESTFG